MSRGKSQLYIFLFRRQFAGAPLFKSQTALGKIMIQNGPGVITYEPKVMQSLISSVASGTRRFNVETLKVFKRVVLEELQSRGSEVDPTSHMKELSRLVEGIHDDQTDIFDDEMISVDSLDLLLGFVKNTGKSAVSFLHLKTLLKITMKE